MNLLSVDPGLLNGWAAWVDGSLTSWGEIPIWDKGLLLIPSFDVMVIEKITLGPRLRIEAAWADGIFRYFAHLSDARIIEQPPSFRLGPRRRHPLSRISSRHARDAIWHGIAYLDRLGVTPDLRRVYDE